MKDLAFSDTYNNQSHHNEHFCNVLQVINDVIAEKEFLLSSLGQNIKLVFTDNTIAQTKIHTLKAAIDSKELYRILSNVINNAIESFNSLASQSNNFNTIAISLFILRDQNEPTKNILSISINDNGVGMTPEQVQKNSYDWWHFWQGWWSRFRLKTCDQSYKRSPGRF